MVTGIRITSTDRIILNLKKANDVIRGSLNGDHFLNITNGGNSRYELKDMLKTGTNKLNIEAFKVDSKQWNVDLEIEIIGRNAFGNPLPGVKVKQHGDDPFNWDLNIYVC